MRRPGRVAQWVAVALITALAAALRLIHIGRVSPDPFYDAAVRSMSMSLHNFFFGAFEPGASVSIDKPPIDLWLQVASVKLLGFNSTTLKLPEAFAGIVSVPLLFVTVRRIWNPAAGLAAALALAVLPVEVITSRSDTMDGVMMALIVLALLFIVRALDGGRLPWLLAGAAVLGLAFNVKLLESLVALPGLAVIAYFGLPGSHRKRLLQVTLAGLLYVAIALSWLTATLIAPASDRPWAIGSKNGSAWNAAFVFNGTERLGGKSPEPSGTVYEPGHKYPTATQSERDHIPIIPPSPTRLLARYGPLSGQRLGLEVLIGLLLGIPALLWGARRGNDPLREDGAAAPEPELEQMDDGDAATDQPAESGAASPAVPGPEGSRPHNSAAELAAANGLRIRRAVAAGLIIWMFTGIALFSHMIRLHPRYVEGFTPVVAAMLGIGVAWVCASRSNVRLALLVGTLAVTVYYVEQLLYGRPGTWRITLLGALAALAFALVARLPRSPSPTRAWITAAGATAMTLVAVLTMPVKADITSIRDHVTDAGYVGALPTEEQHLISTYLRAHQDGAKYEVAAESATQIGSLIVQDGLPVAVLTTYNGRLFTSITKLKHEIAEGKVRYAFVTTFCTHLAASTNPACSTPVRWVREHGTDVSRAAGLGHDKLLYRLPGARP